ncbi:hypothetical protein PCK2_000532 [Pneumocystis canis]|nr:hypothetical protein PCK2_000532 [Pneumocystis canis]
MRRKRDSNDENQKDDLSDWELLSTTTASFSSIEDTFDEYYHEKSNDFKNSNTSIPLKKGKKYQNINFKIIPGYGSDSSTEETLNTIGNISLDKYADFPHIGYDINGKKIMRPATKTALDALLNTVDDKDEWTGIINKDTGKDIRLTSEELDIIRKIQKDQIPDDNFNPFEDYVDYFSGKLEKTPLNSFSEPKRRFIPSKNEQKRIMKIVQAIREGRIVPSRLKDDVKQQPVFYDIWSDLSAKSYDHIMHIPAPKLPLPTHDESYNPPEEYLPSENEINKWNDTSPEDREKNYLPSKYKSLRLVPGYDRFIQECFERCLDLYLAPRVRRNRLNIDPDSLIPKLPSPEDLRPFPTRCSTIYKGHEGRVRSISVDSNGLWLASGGDDGIVRVWEIITGKEMCNFRCSNSEPIDSVAWRPTYQSLSRQSLLMNKKSSILVQDEVIDDNSKQFVLDGHLLSIFPALSKDEISVIENNNKKERKHILGEKIDKRNIFLLNEGHIDPKSSLYNLLNETERNIRNQNLSQRKKLLEKNPSLYVSLTRLAVRNIPKGLSDKDLKTLARKACVNFAKEVKENERMPLTREEKLRDGNPKKGKKGIVRQAKILEEKNGQKRGCGFIEYVGHRWALMGLRWLNGRKISSKKDENIKKRLIVEFALEKEY